MVAKIYEASSPLAEVQSFIIVEKNSSGVPTVGAGHQVVNSVAFNGVDKVTHIVRLYTASGTLLHWYDVQPTVDTVALFDPIYFQVGDGGTNTPAAGQNQLINPAFIGSVAADLSIYQEGFAFLIPGVDYNLTYNTVLLTSTFFDNGQRWRIFKKPVVLTTPVNDSVVGKGFGGFVNVVADISFDVTHLRKLIRLSGTGNYSFNNSLILPIGYNHHFTHFGTEGTTPRINFFNASLNWGASSKSFLYMTFGSTACFTWDGTQWNCTMNSIKDSTVVAPVSGNIIANGETYVGDVSATGRDTLITVTHGLGIGYAYRVFGNLKGTIPSLLNDNNVTWTAYDYQANSFKVALQEFASGVQNITFEWFLMKK